MLFAALQEHEAGLDQYGLPYDETTSILADPDRPEAQWTYGVRVVRNYAADAVARREKDFADDPSRSRIFAPYRIDL